MSRELEPLPSFATEGEERLFWETHDSFDYVDWDNAVRVRFPNLIPSPEIEEASSASEKASD